MVEQPTECKVLLIIEKTTLQDMIYLFKVNMKNNTLQYDVFEVNKITVVIEK